MSELAALIAEQEADARNGGRVNSYSLDALPGVGADLLTRARRLTVTDDRHGTLYCYVRLRCRCAKCRARSALYARERRARRAA